MYPAKYWANFLALPAKKQVFIAMPFSAEFQHRYENVIRPTIDSMGLTSFRVDASKISDSVIDEILAGIGESVLVLADVSADSSGIRNGNVMYEVGLAHAHRPAQSVILIRSDSQPLLFDLSNVRVSDYDPDKDPLGAKKVVEALIHESLSQIDLTLTGIVSDAMKVLDHRSLNFLFRMIENDGRYYPSDDDPKNWIDRMYSVMTAGQLDRLTIQRIIERLLGAGLITTHHPTVGDLADSRDEQILLIEESMKKNKEIQVKGAYLYYELTSLGQIVLFHALENSGVADLLKYQPSFAKKFHKWAEELGAGKDSKE